MTFCRSSEAIYQDRVNLYKVSDFRLSLMLRPTPHLRGALGFSLLRKRALNIRNPSAATVLSSVPFK